MFLFKKNIIRRFRLLVFFFFVVWALLIIIKAGILMTLERPYWLAVAKKTIRYNRDIEPRRGDILSDKGELLVSNLVKYKLYINFDNLRYYNYSESKMKKARHEKDSIWEADLDKLCEGLATIIPQWSAGEFSAHLKEGIKLQRNGGKSTNSRYGRRKYPLCPNHQMYLTYTQFKQIEKLPILCETRRVSGLEIDEQKYRKKFFGSLASSTLGDYKILGEGKADIHGLDERYDSLLRGVKGVKHTEKEKEIIVKPVVHGMDIQTTLNVEMMDICEKALRNGLTDKGSRAGWVILMEVKTGDIKAIVNLSLNSNGEYEETFRQSNNNETPNHAIADLREPGSIFKPIALSIALEDGKIHEGDSVKTYGGKMKMHGRTINDAVRPKREWQTVTEVIQNSSNVGMALIINEAYKNNPQRFTDRLTELGMKENFNLLSCERTPTFRTPKSKLWSPADLQAMSRGYATSQTALNMITFYNAIANNGKRMAPRLVKAIMKDGDIVEEYKPKVLDSKMLSQSTVESLKRMLFAVVNEKGATGARAKSDKVKAAGKTGTALNSKGNVLSFCGFFPYENPEYTCIVQNINNIGGGGSTSAVIFKEIAEKIMANSERRPLSEATDTLHPKQPRVKPGNITSAEYILDEIGIDVGEKNISTELDDPSWGIIKTDSTGTINLESRELLSNIVPNVIGMGAKDALYLMSKAGLRPSITGYGRVVTQSIKAGSKAHPGHYIKLTLKP